jgi:hypothetical protein
MLIITYLHKMASEARNILFLKKVRLPTQLYGQYTSSDYTGKILACLRFVYNSTVSEQRSRAYFILHDISKLQFSCVGVLRHMEWSFSLCHSMWQLQTIYLHCVALLHQVHKFLYITCTYELYSGHVPMECKRN